LPLPIVFPAGPALGETFSLSCAEHFALPASREYPWVPLPKCPQRACQQRSLSATLLLRVGKHPTKDPGKPLQAFFGFAKCMVIVTSPCIPQCFWILFLARLCPPICWFDPLSARRLNPRIGACLLPCG